MEVASGYVTVRVLIMAKFPSWHWPKVSISGKNRLINAFFVVIDRKELTLFDTNSESLPVDGQ